MNENIYAILSRGFPQNADAPFLILPDNKQYSYRQLEQETARKVNAMEAERATKIAKVRCRVMRWCGMPAPLMNMLLHRLLHQMTEAYATKTRRSQEYYEEAIAAVVCWCSTIELYW